MVSDEEWDGKGTEKDGSNVFGLYQWKQLSFNEMEKCEIKFNMPMDIQEKISSRYLASHVTKLEERCELEKWI